MVNLFAVFESPAPPWWDYPGLEVWKFFNLGLFILGLLYFIKRPLGDAFGRDRKPFGESWQKRSKKEMTRWRNSRP